MKRTLFLGLLAGILAFYLSFSGCGWFSDNPMFPTAKIAVETVILDPTGKEAYSGVLGYTVVIKLEEGELIYIPTILRAVKFSFRPLNKVGAEIRKCQIEYYTGDGRAIPSLTTQLDVFISIVPPGTPMNTTYVETQNVALSAYQTTVELYTVRVEEYMRKNKISTLKARVTFLGTDYAGRRVSYTTELPIKAFSGISNADVGEIWYSCPSEGQLNFGVTVINNAEWVQRVDFFFNGRPAGSKTSAPFVSSAVSIDGMCFPATLQVIVTDLLGNQVTKTTTLSENPCSCP